MAGRKKTTGTRKKSTPAKKAPVKKAAVSEKTGASPSAKRKALGIFLIILGIYATYAFATATPGLFDKIVGKVIFTFAFGNTTVMVNLLIIATGVLIFMDKHREKAMTLVMAFLLLVNLMILFSLNVPRLMTYSVVELFSLARYGGSGGIIGILLSYFLQMMVTKVGTVFFVVITSVAEILLIIRANFNPLYQKMVQNRFGLKQMKEKVNDLVEEQKVAKEQREKKNEEQASEEEDFDGLFGKTDIGEVSIDTSFIDYEKIREAIGEEELEQVDEDLLPATEDHGLLQDSEMVEAPAEQSQAAPVQEASVGDELYILKSRDEVQKEPAPEPYHFPPADILDPPEKSNKNKRSEVLKKAKKIEETLSNFGVHARIVGVDVGPSITRFEVQPEAGVKVNKIVNLADDLALNLATSDIRIEAPIPGKAAVGIEVPNESSEIVGIREIIESPAFQNSRAPLTFALGKTLSGQNIIGDISKMPHMLIAGATGSGKSVCINSIIISLLYKCSPEDLKFIMIDPKMVELNQYNAIPHLLIPVVTDPKKAAYALNWGIKEMTERYQLFKENGVREINAYNAKMKQEGGVKLPRIVIIVDELADLMMTSPKECESAICRIAQLARACGIHLIIATQRPSVDVITGLIKANIPSRIAFSVASNTDSRTILDMGGAEKLLGKGDMLYFPVGKSKPLRVQCTFVSDGEINRVIDAVKSDRKAVYNEAVQEALETPVQEEEEDDGLDPLFDQAVETAFTNGQISTSMIQRRLKVGYARAGRLVDSMEQKGIISGPNGSKPRTLLMTREEYNRR